MLVPTFKMHGSKARIAKWVISHFPDCTPKYAEPFAGRGNVFFRLAAGRRLDAVALNDIRMWRFLSAVKSHLGVFDFIPEDPITRETYSRFMSMPDCDEKWIAECCVAYNGNYYGRGANISENSKKRHIKQRTIERLKQARALLAGCDAKITSLDWQKFVATLPRDCFIYIDPPYFGSPCIYPNIDHTQLVKVLNAIENPFALSGYDLGQYRDLEFSKVVTLPRASVAKARGGARGDELAKVETLWVRY